MRLKGSLGGPRAEALFVGRLIQRPEASCSLPAAIAECGVYVDGEEFLAGVVEREVLGGLEEAQFADLLGGHPAGGEVGDGAGGELKADVGDVDLAA